MLFTGSFELIFCNAVSTDGSDIKEIVTAKQNYIYI